MSDNPEVSAGYDLRRRGWTVQDGMLMAGGDTVDALAAREGTPLYIYNLDIVSRRVDAIEKAFPEWQVCYAVKANPHADVVERIYQSGCALEVSSEGELVTALCVAPGEDVGVVGPGKSDKLISRALDADVRWIAAESERELGAIRRGMKTRRTNHTALLLRVNADGDVVGAGERMSGGPSQFGLDEAVASDLLSAPERACAVVGLHLYAGSQLLAASSVVQNSATLLRTFWRLRACASRDLSVLVCGLGLGVNPAITAQAGLSPADIRAELERVDGAPLRDIAKAAPTRELDVGRYLVADCGVLVCRVLDVKLSRGRTFVITDGGIRSFARPILAWAETHGVSAVGKADTETGERVTVVGPACLPGDVMAETANLPRVKRDDLVLIHSVGAYGLTMSPTLFGSFGGIREISVAG